MSEPTFEQITMAAIAFVGNDMWDSLDRFGKAKARTRARQALIVAAPSPSPAQGAVEQMLADLEANLDDAISYLVDLAGAKPSPMSPMNCRIYLDHARMEARRLAELTAAIGAGGQAVGHGYVLVPKEPTEEMIDAGDRVMYGRYGCSFEVAPIYEAMLAASGESSR